MSCQAVLKRENCRQSLAQRSGKDHLNVLLGLQMTMQYIQKAP